MPADARARRGLPLDSAPPPAGLPPVPAGKVRHRHVYRDALERPVASGRVTLTAAGRPGDVVVDLADGVLDVELPFGVWTLFAQLRTVDHDRLVEATTLTLGGPSDA